MKQVLRLLMCLLTTSVAWAARCPFTEKEFNRLIEGEKLRGKVDQQITYLVNNVEAGVTQSKAELNKEYSSLLTKAGEITQLVDDDEELYVPIHEVSIHSAFIGMMEYRLPLWPKYPAVKAFHKQYWESQKNELPQERKDLKRVVRSIHTICGWTKDKEVRGSD